MTILIGFAILVAVCIGWPILKRLTKIGIQAADNELTKLENKVNNKDNP